MNSSIFTPQIASFMQKTPGFETKTPPLKTLGNLFIGSVSIGSKLPYITANPLNLLKFTPWITFECDHGSKTVESLSEPLEDTLSFRQDPSPLIQAFKTALKVLAVGIALASQIPAAYQAANVHPNSYPNCIKAGILTAGAIFPARSLFMLIDDLFRDCEPSTDAKKKLLALIKTNQKAFEKNPNKTEFIQTLKTLNDVNNPEEYFKQLLQETTIPSPETSFQENALNITAIAIGGFFTLTFETFNALYNYRESLNHVSNQQAVAITFSSLAVFSTIYLTAKILTKLTRDTFTSISEMRSENRNQSLIDQFYGKRVLGAKILGTGLNLVSVIACYETVKRYLPKGSYIAPLSCAALFMLFQASTNSFIQDQTKYWGFSHGDKKEILEVSLLFTHFSKWIESMPSSILDSFYPILNMPEALGIPLQSDIETGFEIGTNLSHVSSVAQMGSSSNSSPFPEMNYSPHPHNGTYLDED